MRIKRNFLFEKSIFLLFFIVLVSCSDNILNQEPLTSFSDEQVWQDEDLINAFLARTYAYMPHGFTVSPTRNLILSNVTDETYKRGGSIDFIIAGDITPSNLGYIDRWTGETNTTYLPVIKNANIFFSKIDEADIDEAAKGELKGQMRFLRAHAYFMMTSFFGGVPLLKEPLDLNDDFNIPRNTYEECMNFVVEEFDRSAEELPLEWDNSNRGRITKGAALAMKSRALLYMASPLNNPEDDKTKWQKAADAAKAVIDLGQYSLFPDYKGVFLEENQFNSEIIWCRTFDYVNINEGVRIEQSLYPNGYNGYGQVHPIQNLVDDFQMTNGKSPILGYEEDYTPIVNPESGYDPQNPYINRDPRFYATILFDGAEFKDREVETFYPGGKDTREGALAPHNATLTGYYVRKFIDENITNPTPQNTSNTPWIFSRYAEVLLNYSEALYNLGEEELAREYLNMVRSRPTVEMPDILDSGEELLKSIQLERRIELVFESHRYFDIRRWKIAPEVINEIGRLKMDIQKNKDTGEKSYSVSFFQPRHFHERNYLLPIPQSEIEKNAALKQNPGY